jgi:hypothetical protein
MRLLLLMKVLFEKGFYFLLLLNDPASKYLLSFFLLNLAHS